MYILEDLQGKLVGTYSAKEIRVWTPFFRLTF